MLKHFPLSTKKGNKNQKQGSPPLRYTIALPISRVLNQSFQISIHCILQVFEALITRLPSQQSRRSLGAPFRLLTCHSLSLSFSWLPEMKSIRYLYRKDTRLECQTRRKPWTSPLCLLIEFLQNSTNSIDNFPFFL